MLHGHGIFGPVPMSDMSWTQVQVRHAQNLCPTMSFFLFFFSFLFLNFDTANTANPKKEKKTKAQDFDIWTTT